MDFMGDFFGTNPASPEERAAEMERLIREVEIDHVLKDGKVYMSVDQIIGTYRQVSKMLAIRAFLTQDLLSQGAAGGMDVAANILRNLSGELLRREADAILKADDGV